MWRVKKSDLFKKQLLTFSLDYKQRAGKDVARKFMISVNQAIDFINENPLICGVYIEAQTHDLLKNYQFRKWSVNGFPHSLFFRVEKTNKTIMLECIYAQRMDIIQRFPSDMKN